MVVSGRLHLLKSTSKASNPLILKSPKIKRNALACNLACVPKNGVCKSCNLKVLAAQQDLAFCSPRRPFQGGTETDLGCLEDAGTARLRTCDEYVTSLRTRLVGVINSGFVRKPTDVE